METPRSAWTPEISAIHTPLALRALSNILGSIGCSQLELGPD
jgi:hypothetical protein